MRIKHTSLAFLFLCNLFTANAYATNLPNALLYKDKPIDPLCIYETDSALVTLDKCGIHAKANRKIKEIGDELTQKGFIGFEYTWSADKEGTIQSEGYSYYKVLGKIDDAYVIYALNHSGGSGQFTGLYLLKRESDTTLHITNLFKGDRCNGGINNVTLQNNKIRFNINITASDFFDLAKQKLSHIDINEALPTCAVCCIATANLEMDPKNAANPYLLSIDLGTKPVDVNPNILNKYQYCFNILLTYYQKQGKYLFDQKTLNNFIEQFKTSCE